MYNVLVVPSDVKYIDFTYLKKKRKDISALN